VNVPEQYGIGAIAISPDGKRLYVTGSEVFAIDTATMKIVHRTSVGAVTWGATVSR
jgi:DNA-binding beta-propeller fold protein YncE